MLQNRHVDRRVYGRQRVSVVEDHEVALIPWAEVRRGMKRAPILLTLDHHTDTLPAFNRAACKEAPGIPMDEGKWLAACNRFIEATHFENPASIEAAVQLLGWDEHINAAIETEIVDAALVLAHDNSRHTFPLRRMQHYPFDWNTPGNVIPPRPHRYAVPRDRIFYIPNEKATEWNFRDHAIATWFLDLRLECVGDMLTSLGKTKLNQEEYILDIDLDYFLTPDSLRPDDSTRFHSLLRDAVAVTIATEPACVRGVSDGKLTAEESLAKIEHHIISACGARAS